MGLHLLMRNLLNPTQLPKLGSYYLEQKKKKKKNLCLIFLDSSEKKSLSKKLSWLYNNLLNENMADIIFWNINLCTLRFTFFSISFINTQVAAVRENLTSSILLLSPCKTLGKWELLEGPKFFISPVVTKYSKAEIKWKIWKFLNIKSHIRDCEPRFIHPDVL